MKHVLKCWPIYYAPVASGQKKYEIRKFDRKFSVGDVLIIREYEPPDTKECFEGRFTGRQCVRWITHILTVEGNLELDGVLYMTSKDDPIAIMSLGKLPKGVRL